MRTMYDSVNWSAIPANAAMVAGYVSPSGYAWPQAAWDRFPNAVKVRITPSASHTGLGIHVLDVENGDATPTQAPNWAHIQRSLGQDPTIYCSESAWQSVQRAFSVANEPQPHYWIAAYPGTGANLPSLNGFTAIAHQYADPNTSGGDYDTSAVADTWPGVDQGEDVPLTDADATLVANKILFGTPLIGPDNKPRDNMNVFLYWTNQYANQIPGIASSLSSDESALLAAIKAIPAPVATQVTTDPTAVAQALETAGLPAAVVSALLATLSKAAAPTSAPASAPSTQTTPSA